MYWTVFVCKILCNNNLNMYLQQASIPTKYLQCIMMMKVA